ncbi:MAG: hypothetical protein GY940_07880 [bacterium]|nr:hypothetical protein [bacterium]
MKDTSEKIERIYNEMMMKRSPEERVKMCFSMLNTARRIVFSTITDKKNWRQEMFLRFYGDEFSPTQTKKILHALEKFSKEHPRNYSNLG